MSHSPSLLATLHFLDLFGVPLSREQVGYLTLSKNFKAPTLRVEARDEYFALHADNNFWRAWEEKQALRAKLFKKVHRWSWLFALCPFVRLTAVCNSLALGDVQPNSDIDLFIITAPRRLFLARLCLTTLTQIFGLRRHGDKICGRFCLSFYVTEEAMNLASIALQPQDIYLAFWAQTLIPIAGDHAVYEHFLAQNRRWLGKYFKQDPSPKEPFNQNCFVHRTLECLLDWNILERLAKNLQWPRMQKKYHMLKERSGTVLSDRMLKFHDRDRRREIQEKFNRFL